MDLLSNFTDYIDDLLEHPLVQNMNTLKQHADVANLLEHLLYTSYISYCLSEFFGLRTKEVVRGALLHDFRLNDMPDSKRWFSHSKTSHQSASEHFDLTELEKQIILTHMWPLNPTLFPKSREALVVNIADTYCAFMEAIRLFKKTKATKKLIKLISV